MTKPSGALYVSVPDAGTFTDWLYRWLSRGGGHINPFRDADVLAKQIEFATGLPHRATRLLLSSLSFMNRAGNNRWPRRAWLFGGGHETVLKLWSRTTRAIDRRFGSRLSIYGWALYFGTIGEEVELHTWSNVCVRCGSAHSSASLRWNKLVEDRRFRCPTCGTTNYFTEDAPV